MSDATSADTYFRCTHCKGFYETTFEKCKWCEYDAPLLEPSGEPKVFPNRETCREIQIADFLKLPKDVREDPMGPPLEYADARCECLHCGEEGHIFEAIEMRWMVNEDMWACPCTTCGGRGFDFDIHPIDLGWECVECGHRYSPADGRYVQENCKCPKCGCTEANGWHEIDDEEFDEEELDDEWVSDETPAIALPDEQLPWENDTREWKPGDDERDDAEDFDENPGDGERKLPDDIDFPRKSIKKDRDTLSTEPFNEDDIPF